MTTTPADERKAFEKWYSTQEFDYGHDPIGSRECGMLWTAWQARAALSTASPPPTVMAELVAECKELAYEMSRQDVSAVLSDGPRRHAFEEAKATARRFESAVDRLAAAPRTPAPDAAPAGEPLAAAAKTIADQCPDCDHGIRGGKPCQSCDGTGWLAVAAPAGEPTWHPIETAPNDGLAYILVANEGGAWVAHWAPVAVSGYTFAQPWRSCMLNHNHIDSANRYMPPTHWMPLPAAPSEVALALAAPAGEPQFLPPFFIAAPAGEPAER